MKINFNNKQAYRPGLISTLLQQSYQNIPTTTNTDKQSFQSFDKELSQNPNWLGQYVFITTTGDKPIGFASFDPRQKPVAQIGHNCIIPKQRGKGLGSKQLQHLLTQIKSQGFTKIIVSTGQTQDFIPAQKMYQSCGFTETGKFTRGGKEMVGFEQDLD